MKAIGVWKAYMMVCGEFYCQIPDILTNIAKVQVYLFTISFRLFHLGTE
jgi:hypothetical protein